MIFALSYLLILFNFLSCTVNFNLGIPGCAKSTLCKEILSTPGRLGDDRPVHSLMGDLVKGIQMNLNSHAIS